MRFFKVFFLLVLYSLILKTLSIFTVNNFENEINKATISYPGVGAPPPLLFLSLR